MKKVSGYRNMLLRLVVDTCVWLDIAKDYRQQPVISALQDLIRAGLVELVVPQVVKHEFARNKARIIAETQRSLQSHFQLVRDAVERFGDDAYRGATLEALNEVDHKIAFKGEAVISSVEEIEKLLSSVRPLAATSAIKRRVTDRALAGFAPYHRSKNSVADAIIIETYAALLGGKSGTGTRHAFVTHNVKDFSEVNGDRRKPHADLADLFGSTESTYWVSLVDLIKAVDPGLLEDHDAEFNYMPQPRRLSEILDAERLLFRQVWYNRHWNLRMSIQGGAVKVVPKEDYSTRPYRQDQILDTVWAGALKAAKRTEAEVGLENLGPWSDFEWGMINGKLSAVRWILGEEWDMLDT